MVACSYLCVYICVSFETAPGKLKWTRPTRCVTYGEEMAFFGIYEWENDFGPTESALATWSRVLPRPRRGRLLVSNAVMDFRGNQPLFR